MVWRVLSCQLDVVTSLDSGPFEAIVHLLVLKLLLDLEDTALAVGYLRL
jgi:hypothetical protein